MSRLRRQEIKRDEVRAFMGEALDWGAQHRRQLLQWLAALGVALLAGALVLAYLAGRGGRARQAFAEALHAYHAPIVEADQARPEDREDPSFADQDSRRARARELFERAYSYRGTSAARLAAVYLGEIDHEQGDPAAARRYWEEFVEGRGNHALKGAVWQNLFSLDRQEGRTEQLAETLHAQLGGSKRILPEDVLLWELAVTYELDGKSVEARDVLQRLVDEFPRSPYTGEARLRLEALQS